MIFIDTGAFLARYIAKDEHHAAARSCWSELKSSKSRLFTSNFVVDETVTLLGRRAGYAFAAERARALLSSRIISILRPESHHELEAVKIFEKFADQRMSFTDCTSFVLMRSNIIEKVFTFDRHFDLGGFTRIPGFYPG